MTRILTLKLKFLFDKFVKMRNTSIIVAVAESNAIGIKNQLLCHLPNDLKRFKRITSGHTVIMGKKTYESLPIKPLPKRVNIVISDNKNDCFQDCVMAYSIEEALSKCDKDTERFVIGGASIYKQFLPLADKLYLTKIHHRFEADVFFPEINFNEWTLIESEDHASDAEHSFSYSFLTYVRKMS